MSINTDYRVLRKVLADLDATADLRGPVGFAAEFGVYSGYSLDIIAQFMPVVGFDSFEGLPEDWRPGFPKGTFAVPPDGPSVQDILLMGPNRMVVPGLFADTLPDFPFPKLDLVHIDCDLYSSTVVALDAVATAVDIGTVIVFDEYEGADFDDEKRAFTEWLAEYNYSADLLYLEGEEAAFRLEEGSR